MPFMTDLLTLWLLNLKFDVKSNDIKRRHGRKPLNNTIKHVRLEALSTEPQHRKRTFWNILKETLN